MLSRDKYSDYIEQAISDLAFPTEPKGLYEPISYTLERGGKRVRPMLLLASAQAFGGKIEDVVKQALGIEMFHNFTLLHDDVMDNADLRRGCPTVHKKWNPSTAILSGDAMLTIATRLIADCDRSILELILSHFNKTAIEIYEGQQYDMDFESRLDVTLDEYTEMIRLKTSVLLGAACYIGAVAALGNTGCLSEENLRRAEVLREYAVYVGLAFQLRDDYLDTFGDPLTFGKEIGGDIINNKKTWLLTAAIEQDKDNVLSDAIVKKIYDDDPAKKIEFFKNEYVRLGIPEQCTAQINEYIGQAVEKLKEVSLSHEAMTFFRDFAQSSADRIC